MSQSVCRRHCFTLVWVGPWEKGLVRLRCMRCRIWWEDR